MKPTALPLTIALIMCAAFGIVLVILDHAVPWGSGAIFVASLGFVGLGVWRLRQHGNHKDHP